MEKKKKKLGLLPKLLIAIVLGLIVGFACQKFGEAGKLIIQIGATYNDIFGNFLNFCIPLIIIGFVVPGIADLGSGAGKTLAATTGVAYLSTIIAGSLAYIVDVTIFPSLVHADMFMTNAQNAEETALSGLFTIEMPPIMGVMEALLISFILGLGLTFIKDDTLKVAIKDFSEIVTKLVGGVIIPLLPIHVYGIFAKLTYAGTIVELMTSFIKVFVVILILHCVILIFQYTVAGTAAKKNPFSLIKNMIPAYTTAIGTQSSAATIPVNKEACNSIGVPEDISDLVLPMGCTMHMDGSVLSSITKIAFLYGVFGMDFSGAGTYGMAIVVAILSAFVLSGAPGGGLVGEMLIVSMFNFPAEAFPIIATLGFLFDPAATCLNASGDTIASMLVTRLVEGKEWLAKAAAAKKSQV